MNLPRPWLLGIILLLLVLPGSSGAQEEETEDSPQPAVNINTGISSQVFVGKNISFGLSDIELPEEFAVQEILWDFGDGTRTTGEKVAHTYRQSGTYTVRVSVTTDQGVAENNADITVFEHVAVLLTDSTTPQNEIEVKQQQAAKTGLLLLVLRDRGGGPEVVAEEELTNQLVDARDALSKTNLIIAWTSGSVGSSVLSKFAQRLRQADELSAEELQIELKGVIILSDTPFGVLAPTTQAAFDQLKPSYVLLTKPQAIDILLEPLAAEEAKDNIIASPIAHRLLGTFSARAIQDLNVTNFMSFGINFLVNQGVPINNITLILMLPVIATILSVSRQFIGIKAFGIITPAMTTLSFLVLGLQYGLLVFAVVLLAGTVTRLILRKLRLLYLPRMALVLTSVSLSILALFALGISTNNTTLLSFSIFPILILTLLAEEFIAVQFTAGARQALTITAWTLALAVVCYYIVSWELLRTIVVSYPEVILLAIPINILLGRWSGLRLTEYFRFRKLLRYTQ
jgi:hypothetical protein